MLTSYNDYKNDIFAKKVMALDYIDKEGFEEPLKDTIKRAVEIMHGKNTLIFHTTVYFTTFHMKIFFTSKQD